jgi:hypothetical protein
LSTRGISSALEAAADADNIRLLMFIKMELDSGTIHVHEGVGTLTWGGFDWLGLGDFGGISSIEESEQISPFEVTLTLSGLDTDMMNEVMNQNYYLRPVTIYMGALDLAAGTLVDEPDEIWSGFLDTASVSLGDDNGIMITCESEFAIFDQSNDSTFSDADLQADHPGDLFFEFLPSMVDSIVVWRGENVSVGAAHSGGSSGSASRGGGFQLL